MSAAKEHTPEQQLILDTVTGPKPPPALILNAGPGCGKTYILEEIIRSLPKADRPDMLCTAFNKDIVGVLVKRIPRPVKISTIHALCLGIWGAHIEQPYLKPDTSKSKQILEAIAEDGRWTIAPEEYEDLLSIIRLAKSQGYLPPGSASAYRSLCTFDQLIDLADITTYPHYEELINLAMNMSVISAFQGLIDFDDMCYMAAFFATGYPKVKWLFVDEAQDLTPLQLLFLRRLKAQHVVLVGDPLQAIYAFRGAMTDSFQQIAKSWPKAVTLPLQISFRVPTSLLPLLQSHNPLLRSNSKIFGTMSTLQHHHDMEYMMRKLAPMECKSRAILCRNNAPLYRAALSCLASQVRFTMRDNGWGFNIVRDIKRVARNLSTFPAEDLFKALEDHWTRADMTDVQIERMMDKLNCIAFLAERHQTASGVVKDIENLVRSSNMSDSAQPLLLSTAHKAKGLEFDWVLHLDPHLIPSKFAKTPEDFKQEANIAYVINSRSKHTLLFCDSELLNIPGPTYGKRPNTRTEQPV